MVLSKNEYQLLIHDEEQVLSPKNQTLLFRDSNRKRILLFCCTILPVVAICCLLSFYYFQFEFFQNQTKSIDDQHFNIKHTIENENDQIRKLVGEYEYCDRTNGPYIRCLNGGVCVKIDCYILEFKNWNECIQCICLEVFYFDLAKRFDFNSTFFTILKGFGGTNCEIRLNSS
jgi:hypothetical protein